MADQTIWLVRSFKCSKSNCSGMDIDSFDSWMPETPLFVVDDTYPELNQLLNATAQQIAEREVKQVEIENGLLDGLFSSQIPAPRYDLREAKMIARAQEKVMLSTDWINASELLELIGNNHLNKNASINLLKESKKVFGVVYRGEGLFPIYILDKHNGYSPYAGLQPVLELFSGVKNSWGCAYWFAGANGFLNGARPQDCLAANPEAVLAAAKIELEGITHG